MVAMKVIKAAFIIAAVFFNFIFFALPQNSASAESGVRYAYVDTDSTVYFCEHKNRDDALFEIPQTYCIEILGEEDGWYKIKYADDDGVFQAVYGFCEPDGLILSDKEPETKYLKQTVTVTYRTEDVGDMLEGLPTIEYKAAYYGSLTVRGRVCSYVLCNGYFGYITGAIEDYPLNPLPDKPAFAPTDAPQNGSSAATLITALVVTAIAVIAISVLYFSGKKPPKNP